MCDFFSGSVLWPMFFICSIVIFCCMATVCVAALSSLYAVPVCLADTYFHYYDLPTICAYLLSAFSRNFLFCSLVFWPSTTFNLFLLTSVSLDEHFIVVKSDGFTARILKLGVATKIGNVSHFILLRRRKHVLSQRQM